MEDTGLNRRSRRRGSQPRRSGQTSSIIKSHTLSPNWRHAFGSMRLIATNNPYET